MELLGALEAEKLTKQKCKQYCGTPCKSVLDHQPNFHKDPCKNARTQGENGRTCDALQRFRSESTKIKKMRFSAIFK